MPTPLRGELWWCEPPHIGGRPVVVLSRDAAANLDSVESVTLAALVERIGRLSDALGDVMVDATSLETQVLRS